MSALPVTNGETAKEMLKRALVAKGTADWNSLQGRDHWEFACRNYVYAAELALKAVYVKHEKPFERTHDIQQLYENCPDSCSPVMGFTNSILQSFSSWYLAPYFIERQATEQDLSHCQSVSTRIVRWAEGIIFVR